MESVQRYRAGAVIVTSGDVRASSEVAVSGGRIVGVRDVPTSELADEERRSVLAPGWVNAHAHLELGALAGCVPAGTGFVDWVGGVLAQRGGLDADALAAGARASAGELLAGGTQALCDIDSLDVVRSALAGATGPDGALAVVHLIELIDASPAVADARTEDALERARAALARGDGWSPHAVHTVGDALLEGLSDLLRSHVGPPPVRSVHWAESPEEVEWLLDGTGPFAGFLGPSPRVSGLERLARAGLLDGTLLVHGNHPLAEELDLLRGARDVAIAHCPGSHAFFGRDPFPLDAYRERGVPVVLGTDSAASNDSLDMGREVRLARETLGMTPAEAFAAATEGAARWVRIPGVTGTLEPGSRGFLVRRRDERAGEGDVLARLTEGALGPPEPTSPSGEAIRPRP